jgi:hypothetical protein
MPDRDVETVRDLVFYQYAKLIARSAFGVTDGTAVKREHYGFVKMTFRRLKNGEMNWSDILREDRQLLESEQACAYCGNRDDLTWEHVVPRSLFVHRDCPECDRLQGIHNHVLCCRRCNSKKGTKGLYTFFKDEHAGERRFYDFIPSLVEKKYLKTVYCCHECAGTLLAKDLDADGRLTILDLDEVVKRHVR